MSKTETGSGFAGSEDFVTVRTDRQWFGIPVRQVQDVFLLRAITPVPLSPPEVAGVLNLRGRIVTAIDMRRRLGLGSSGCEQSAMAVGIEKKGESYGLIVDHVGEVRTLELSDFERNPPNLDPRWRSVSRGVYRLKDGLLAVLDVDRVLDVATPRQAA